jgi:hypothetical protein
VWLVIDDHTGAAYIARLDVAAEYLKKQWLIA